MTNPLRTPEDYELFRANAIACLRSERRRLDLAAARALESGTLIGEAIPFSGHDEGSWAGIWEVKLLCALNLRALDVPEREAGLFRYRLEAGLRAVAPEGATISLQELIWNPAATRDESPPRPEVTNQARNTLRRIEWKGLRFRSKAEKCIAIALDERGVLFFPLAMARLDLQRYTDDPPGTPPGRTTKEPDFLICHRGRWGILEVDGDEHHPPERATEDHARDRLFQAYGLIVSRFDADDCTTSPEVVVQRFLGLLEGPK